MASIGFEAIHLALNPLGVIFGTALRPTFADDDKNSLRGS